MSSRVQRARPEALQLRNRWPGRGASHTSAFWLPFFGLALLSLLGPDAHSDPSANVTVNAGATLGTLVPGFFGANAAAWDPHLLDASLPALIQQAGVSALRFPGGLTADFYHWRSQTVTVGAPGSVNPADTFDAFMGVASQAGVPAVVTVNYGSNPAGTAGADPAEAASWVAYAKAKGYLVANWEIGNEVYGNSEYGAHWAVDLHSDHSPAAYGANALEFIRQMKAADPSASVGVVLTAPGNWPDGENPDWNSAVLAACGQKIDFVAVHWYAQDPGSESDAGLLASPLTGVPGHSPGIPAMMAKLRTLIGQYCGANAGHVKVLITETNSVSYNPGKQTVGPVNALFAADNVMTWLENGAAGVDWWALHNGMNLDPNKNAAGNNGGGLAGGAAFGDYGLLSDGSASRDGRVEPAANTPFPAFYGLQMLGYLGKAGDSLVSAASDQSLVAAHAVRQAGGGLALLLVNKAPSNAYSVNISLSGYAPADNATAYTYANGGSAITSAAKAGAGGRFTLSLPPYSLTTLVLKPGPSVAAPAFSSSAVASPATVAPGAAAAITCTVTDTGGPLTGLVDCEIYDGGGSRIAQQSWDGQAFAAGQSRSYSFPWVAPAAPGAYTIKVGVFQPGWAGNVAWNAAAGQVTVAASAAPASSFSLSAVALPATLAPGGTTTVRATVQDTGTALAGGIIDLEVWNSAGERVGQQYYAGQNLAAGGSYSYTWAWTAPATSGSYTVKVGVFDAGWKSLAWNDGAATITAANTDASQYNFEAGMQGWVSSGGMITGAMSTGVRPYAGSKSLALTFSSAAADTQRVSVTAPPVTAGKVVTFHMWVPQGSAISAVQPYVLQGAAGGWRWTGNWQPLSALTSGAWNTLSVTVPTGAAPLDSLGVEFSTSGRWTGTCYIDAVGWP